MTTIQNRRWAVALVVAVLFVLALAGVTARTAPAQEVGPVPVDAAVEYRIPLPDEVRAAMERATGARPEPMGSAEDALAPNQAPEVIVSEGFEGETFPPEGWEVADRIAAQAGTEDQWTWGRQTCEVPTNGGQAAAWGLGGGEQGGALPCWTAYTEPVDGLLIYGGIDTTNYPGGVSATFVFKPDIPRNQAFSVCWAPSPEEDATCRAYNVPPEQQNRWLVPSDTVLPDTANLTDLVVFFRYVDDEPNGTSRGAIVDNVLIEGLLEEPTEPATAQPTNTRAPTQPPRPTNTPRTGIDVYLPFLLKKFDTENLPTAPPPPEWEVIANMGTVNMEGEFEYGTQYQYGVMGICLQVEWTDLEVGDLIRWQWFQNDEAIAPDNTDLNRTIDVTEPEGWYRSCIQYSNQETGERFPLPEGTYRADVWALNVGENDPIHTSAEAVIGQEGTPPPVTPTPTATLDPGQYECVETVVNGGFEDGPDFGWEVAGNYNTAPDQPVQPSDIIGTYADLGITGVGEEFGEWFAFFRWGSETFEVVTDLRQTESLPEIEADKVASAQLVYYAGLFTEETPDGEHNDRLGAFFVTEVDPEGAVQGVPIPGSLMSEETHPPERFYRIGLDVTDLVKQRATEGWPEMRLGFQVRQDTANFTQFLLDRVALELCTEIGSAPPVDGARRFTDLSARPSMLGTVPMEAIGGRPAVVRASGVAPSGAHGVARGVTVSSVTE